MELGMRARKTDTTAIKHSIQTDRTIPEATRMEGRQHVLGYTLPSSGMELGNKSMP